MLFRVPAVGLVISNGSMKHYCYQPHMRRWIMQNENRLEEVAIVPKVEDTAHDCTAAIQLGLMRVWIVGAGDVVRQL